MEDFKVTSATVEPVTEEEEKANVDIQGETYTIDYKKIRTMKDVRLFLEIAHFTIQDSDPNFKKGKRILKKIG